MLEKLLVLDVDGTLCPGSKGFDKECQVLKKYFCDIDRTAIKLFKARGWKVCFLSGDTNINRQYAGFCEVDFWSSKMSDGTLNKVLVFEDMLRHYKVDIKNTVVIGDDVVFDGPLCHHITLNGGYAFCPNDAHAAILSMVTARLNSNAGSGVVMDAYCFFYKDNFDIGEYGH